MEHSFKTDFSRVKVHTDAQSDQLSTDQLSTSIQTALIQRARANLGALNPAEVLQLQRTIGNRGVGRLLAPAVQRQSIQRTENKTGLADSLKSGIESLSGISMDGVNVHYNSSDPAQLNGLAYAQGTNIYVAPGQERHLPHEAWHVVQQAQGRVQPTRQIKDGVAVNDDEGLEHEADVMGAKASEHERTAARPDSVSASQANADAGQLTPGKRDTWSRGGQELITLTYTVQQRGMNLQRSPRRPVSISQVQRVRRSKRQRGALHSTHRAFGFDEKQAIGAARWKNVPHSSVLAMLSMELDDGTPVELGTAKNNQSVAHGQEHAEDVVIRIITTNIGLFKKAPDRNKLIIGLTASPCTTVVRPQDPEHPEGDELPTTSSKQPGLLGCAEALISLVTNGITQDGKTYLFDLVITCKGLYAPPVEGFNQADVLAASQAAVEAMRAEGIDVSGDVRPSRQAQRYEIK